MANIYTYRDLVLVESKTLFERFVSSVVKFVGYTSSYACYLTSLTFHGLSIGPNVWKQQSFFYEENGEKVYRSVGTEGELLSTFRGKKTLTEIFLNHIKEYANCPMLGWRKVLNVIEEKGNLNIKYNLGPFEWLTSEEVYRIVASIYAYFQYFGLSKNSKVLIFAATSQDWLMVAIATMFLRATIVTVYPSLRDEYIISCLQLTEPEIVLVDSKTWMRFRTFLPQAPSVKVVLFDSQCDQCHVDTFGKNLVKLTHMDSILFTFSEKKVVPEIFSSSEPEDLALIMFTSGSTGTPKGAMITQANIVAVLAGSQTPENFWSNQTYPAYLPLSHIMEFCCEFALIFHGGRIGYCNSTTLFDSGPMLAPGCLSDLKALRPTCMAFVPLLLERIRRTMMEKLSSVSRTKRVIIETAYNVKSYFYSRGYNTPLLNSLIFNKFSDIFGGNMKYGVIGGAYLSPQLEEFFNIMIKPMKQAYGTTEICCAGTISGLNYIRPFNVGPPIQVSELKLLPWKEGGYDMSDPQHPKGELVISGPCVCLGYYRNEELTQESFILDQKTQKRWFHTADIAELLEDGTFRIIARKTDVAKLSHGEYVEFSPIQSVIAFSRFVDYVCVTTNPEKTYLVALVAPNLTNILSVAGSIAASDADLKFLLQKKEILEALEADILGFLKNATFNKFEIPKKFLFVPDEWSPDSDLLTPSMKIKRTQILRKYNDLIQNT